MSRGNNPGAIIKGEMFLVSNYLQGQLSGGQFSSGAIILRNICLGGNHPGVIFLSGNCPYTLTYMFKSIKQVYLQKLVKTFYSLRSKFAV